MSVSIRNSDAERNNLKLARKMRRVTKSMGYVVPAAYTKNTFRRVDDGSGEDAVLILPSPVSK